MISAREARRISEDNADKLYEREIKGVEASIKEAASQGKYQCYVNWELSSSALTYLRDQGYGATVKCPDDCAGTSYTCVYWREV